MLNTLLKNNARSLYLSAKILPRHIRRPFYCAYLLCRIADSVADTDIIPAKERLDIIRMFPYIVEKQQPQMISKIKMLLPEDTTIYKEEKALIASIDLCLSAFNALNDYHKKVTLDVIYAVCFAMEWDLSFFPTQSSGLLKALVTTEDTIRYCDYMGGQPGLFWAKLILDGKEDASFTERARRIGRALQIVNILRDIPADIAIGRIYLPMSDITKNDLMPQDFLDKKNYKKLKPIIEKWIAQGVSNLEEAPAFITAIPFFELASRIAVALPVLWCADTLLLLAQAKNLLDGAKRVKIERKNIYRTMLMAPFMCINANVFRKVLNKKIIKVKSAIGAN